MAAALPPAGIKAESLHQISPRAAGAALMRGQRAAIARDGGTVALIEGFWRWDNDNASRADGDGAATLLRRFRDQGVEFLRHLHGSFATHSSAPCARPIRNAPPARS